MEQANAGYCFGRNHCWLAAINACTSLDALANSGDGLELLNYQLSIPASRVPIGKRAHTAGDLSRPQITLIQGLSMLVRPTGRSF